MFDKLIKQSKIFQKLAEYDFDDPEGLDEPEDLELMSNIEDKFRDPTDEDKELIMRLVKDSAEALSQGMLNEFAKYFTNLDSYVRSFVRESFTPQFYDLIADENMFDWVYSIKNKSDYSDYDTEAAKFILDDLKSFNSVDKIFE